MVIEFLRSEGKSEAEIRQVIHEMKTKSIDKYLNRHKIGEIITNENQKLLSASTDASNKLKYQGPLKLRNISVDNSKTQRLRKQELWDL